MIVVHVVENLNQIQRFSVSGHAGYAPKGQDIVCAAVSALVYNAINGCEYLLHTKLTVDDDSKRLSCFVPEDVNSDDVQLLLHSMVFGIEETAKLYPKRVVVRRDNGM